MLWGEAALLLIGGLVALMAIGVPVAIAFLAINILGVLVFLGGMAGVDQLVANASGALTTFTLVPAGTSTPASASAVCGSLNSLAL